MGISKTGCSRSIIKKDLDNWMDTRKWENRKSIKRMRI